MTQAVLFPGLGAVRPAELGKFLVLDPVAADRLAAADEVLGYRVLERFAAEGDQPAEATRVAFLIGCVSLADWSRRERGYEPGYHLGLSLGEQVALAYTGCLSFPEAVRLTAEIARVELGYFAGAHPGVVTLPVTRLPGERLDELLAAMAERGEWHEVSGRLDDDVAMVTLTEEDLAGFSEEVGRAGGYTLRPMRPPAHAARFGPLRDLLAAEVLPGFTFAAPRLPLVGDAGAAPVPDGAAARAMLLDGFVRPLRWRDTAYGLSALGVSELAVVGPDRLWHRLGVTTRLFDVVTVDQAAVLRHRRNEPLST